jgi:uncharacterized protein (DUF1800 family)
MQTNTENPSPVSSANLEGAAIVASLSLTACGGGGSAGGASGVTPSGPTDADWTAASRLLAQAAWGGNKAGLSEVIQNGAQVWLNTQLAAPLSRSMTDWLVEKNFHDPAVSSNVNGDGGWPNAMWWKLFSAADPVRQRAVLAWSEHFVVSALGLPISWRNFALANYWETLEKNAFGNFRALLEAVTLSSAMGSYLNMKGNQKANPAIGRSPDENYAREVMQLFTIGLYKLQADGSLQLDARGQPIETYDNNDIQGLAKVFTGWNLAGGQDPSGVLAAGAYRHGLPMVLDAALHSPEEKRFLGQVIPAGTDAKTSLKIALDTLFNHPNTAPFVCKQLIQRLVTSNPSPAYVARVAQVFANDDQGVRGNLKAVWLAMLLDAEARSPGSGASGKLREPVVRLVQWGRSFSASSSDGLWGLGYTDADTNLGQMPLRAPSVFNFFRPGYVPPNTAISANQWLAPEFQIVTEPTVVGYINFMVGTVNNARTIKADYSNELLMVNDPGALLAWLNVCLAGGAISVDNQALMVQALSSMPASTDANKLNRIYAAILLVMASTDYLIQR